MRANEYQSYAARTLIDAPGFYLHDDEIMIIWNAIGLAGETGEVVDAIKKQIFHQHGIDHDQLIKELGDVCWYLAALCTKLEIDLGEVMEQNIWKLMDRYPDGFNSEDSKLRRDIGEE